MTTTATPLPDDVESLQALLLEQDAIIKEKTQRITVLEEYIRYVKQRLYGRSSERDVNQGELFNEAEIIAGSVEEAEQEDEELLQASELSGKTPKKKRGRRKLPKHLQRIKVYHDLDEHEKQCDCGCQLHCFDEVISEQLGIIPAKLYVIQHCRKKYTCQHCDGGIKTAPLPPQPIPKSNASPELLAHIVISKFLDGLPFYRQEKMWERNQIDLPRATMANWTMQCGGSLVQPLINLFREEQQTGSVLYIDETPVQVLKHPDKPPDGKKYFWVTAGGPTDRPVYLFHYNPSRGSAVAKALIEGFEGTLMSDDWHVYAAVCSDLSLSHINCNDHARRKFKEAKENQAKTKKGQQRTSRADVALAYYKRLYAIETQIRGLSPDLKKRVRQEKSVPIWEAFKEWIDTTITRVTPESKQGKALSYAHRLFDKLTAYCEDGNLPISNQVAENAIRPFAIARKNFLFFNTPGGAQASANHYSLIMTARANGLDPFYYLAYIFKQLPAAKGLEDYEALLPWNLDSDTLKASFELINRPV